MDEHIRFFRGLAHGLFLSAWLWFFLYLGLSRAL